MTETKRIRLKEVITEIGIMRSFDADLFSAVMRVDQNTAYHWMRRNTGKFFPSAPDVRLVTWIYSNRLGGMFVPRDQEIRGMTYDLM